MQLIIAAHRRDKLMAKIQLDKLYDWPHAKKRGVKDLMLLLKLRLLKINNNSNLLYASLLYF